MKVIVFGGSGFIGSHTAEVLSENGYDVTIFDNKPSPYLKKPQKLIIGDILDQKLVEDTIKDSDIVYNFAGIADIDEASKSPLKTIEINIMGNAIILEACRKAGVKRFIFASSIYVYSKAGSFYRSTKQACELLIENYNELYGLPYTILRYGSLYGPRASEKSFIHSILKQALKQKKITREGDGEEIREYIHVFDAARCSVEILSKDFVNQYVIITGNQTMKIKDLFVMIKEILGNKIKIEYKAPKVNFHYEITPYTFAPKLAKRYVSKTYLDLGQGILKTLQEIHQGEISRMKNGKTGEERNKRKR